VSVAYAVMQSTPVMPQDASGDATTHPAVRSGVLFAQPGISTYGRSPADRPLSTATPANPIRSSGMASSPALSRLRIRVQGSLAAMGHLGPRIRSACAELATVAPVINTKLRELAANHERVTSTITGEVEGLLHAISVHEDGDEVRNRKRVVWFTVHFGCTTSPRAVCCSALSMRMLLPRLPRCTT